MCRFPPVLQFIFSSKRNLPIIQSEHMGAVHFHVSTAEHYFMKHQNFFLSIALLSGFVPVTPIGLIPSLLHTVQLQQRDSIVQKHIA